MAEQTHSTAKINWVAIDIGRYWNAVLVETASGKRHRFKMGNCAGDFERLIGFSETVGGQLPRGP